MSPDQLGLDAAVGSDRITPMAASGCIAVGCI